MYNVLFLCQRNSARSLMAEAILNRLGIGKFRAYSAGSQAAAEIHPYAFDLIRLHKLPTDPLRPKGWDEFIGKPDLKMDFVITVCDTIRAENCPTFPGEAMRTHWAFPDPVMFAGTEAEKRAIFADVYGRIHNRLSIFVNLPIDSLGRLALKHRLDDLATPPSSSNAA